MKIGILTFPHSPSLGAMLQMRALYKVIENLGHDVEIVNYVSDRVIHKKKQAKTIKGIIVQLLCKIFIKNSKTSFQSFERELRMFPPNVSYTQESLKMIENHFDRIVVGSDQVWNPVVTGNDMNFYLDFCKNPEKKVSYAASFGYTSIAKDDKEQIARLLKDFAHISVREKDGAELVNELIGRNVSVVLDPTLLVESQYLSDMAISYDCEDDYVVFFNIKPSQSLYNCAKEYAEKYNLKLVTIGGRLKDIFTTKKRAEFGVGPKEFLGIIRDAKCVFTNSFHGMAVSVALHTNFYVEFSSDTNSRLSNLADILKLQDRILQGTVPENRDINYVDVDKILEEYRQDSMNYLKEALSENK